MGAQVLTLSLPSHRVEGSWRYREVDIVAPSDSRRAPAPRFDPTKYIRYPAHPLAACKAADTPLHSAPTGCQPSQLGPSGAQVGSHFKPATLERRPATARSRLETVSSEARPALAAEDWSGLYPGSRGSARTTQGPQTARGPEEHRHLARRFAARLGLRSRLGTK